MYNVIWLEIASTQYAALPPPMRVAFDAKLAEILNDPQGQGVYNKESDQWSATFASGAGIVTYAVSVDHGKVAILRIIAIFENDS